MTSHERDVLIREMAHEIGWYRMTQMEKESAEWMARAVVDGLDERANPAEAIHLRRALKKLVPNEERVA